MKLKKIKNIFLKTEKGAMATEFVITTPLALVITFLSIMILIFVLDFFLISSSMSRIVDSLNMGDSGYSELGNIPDSSGIHTPLIRTKKYSADGFGLGTAKNKKGDPTISVKITNNKYFSKATKYYLRKENSEGGFTVPFANLKEISVKVYDSPGHEREDFSIAKGKTESGDMIVAKIKYDFCGFINVSTSSFGFID